MPDGYDVIFTINFSIVNIKRAVFRRKWRRFRRLVSAEWWYAVGVKGGGKGVAKRDTLFRGQRCGITKLRTNDEDDRMKRTVIF